MRRRARLQADARSGLGVRVGGSLVARFLGFELALTEDRPPGSGGVLTTAGRPSAGFELFGDCACAGTELSFRSISA